MYSWRFTPFYIATKPRINRQPDARRAWPITGCSASCCACESGPVMPAFFICLDLRGCCQRFVIYCMTFYYSMLFWLQNFWRWDYRSSQWFQIINPFFVVLDFNALIVSEFPVGQLIWHWSLVRQVIWIKWFKALATNLTSREIKMCCDNLLIGLLLYLYAYITNHFVRRVMGIAIDRGALGCFHQAGHQPSCISVNKCADF